MERLEELPVAVELAGELGREVARYVEVEAGWQVVERDGPLTPVLTVAPAPLSGRPCVVVAEGTATTELVRDGLLAGALDVLGWPEDRARLLEAPLRVREETVTGHGPALIRVAGTAGGVGTSTVALALAGLAAWAGRRVAVVGGDDLLWLCGFGGWTGPGAAELLALGSDGATSEFSAVARPVAGVDRLFALRGDGGALDREPRWPVDVVVADLGARAPATGERAVTVGRPDASLRVATSSPVIVVGRGPLDRSGVRRFLGRPPDGWLPFSARVARAGLAGRVPSALPGAWLAALRRPFVLARSSS